MKNNILLNIDWICVLIYLLLVSLGWCCIYATGYDPERTELLSFNSFHGKQLVFIVLSCFVAMLVLSVETKVYEQFAWVFYAFTLLLLLGLMPFGKEINGAKAWYVLGGISIQPTEFAKVATALAFARQLSSIHTNISKLTHLLKVLLVMAIPMALIMLQPDVGSVLLFASFAFALNREGMNPIYLILLAILGFLFLSVLKFGTVYTMIGFTLLCGLYAYYVKKQTRLLPLQELLVLLLLGISVSVVTPLVYEKVFKQHHRDRFNLWLNIDKSAMQNKEVLRTIAYNTVQSQAAISSGGLSGKGFLEGTRTKGGFVPEQHTDYIFSTLGEEWGFYGTSVVVVLFALLCLRIWYLAEQQKRRFNRVYGYCVAAIFLMHFVVNIGMVIGLIPTIGIPLPFFSYGGSSLLGATILLFIFLRLDVSRDNEWS